MKQLTNFFKAIYLFFFHLTPKGREAKFYDDAHRNMQEAHAINEIPKRVLKIEINNFLNHNKGIRLLTSDQKELLVLDKFGKKMKELNLKLHPVTKHLVNA